MSDSVAKLELITRDPLQVGQRQSLALKITTCGNDSVYLSVPLGDTAAALMSRAEFESCAFDFPQGKPRGVLDPQLMPEDACVRIPISRVGTELSFEVSLADFLVDAHPGPVELALHPDTRSAPPASTVTVQKWSTPPRIASFTADRYNVVAGGLVRLAWILTDEAEFQLLDAQAPDKPIQTGRGTSGSWHGPGRGDYLLRAMVGGVPVDTRHLRIHRFSVTGFESYELNLPALPEADILGLYAHPGRGRLYALLRAGPGAARAEVWSTGHGFDPDPGTWTPETNGRGETVTLSLDAARRPGAIFQNRLWLLGGDCCDPDAPGSAVGYYDFQETAWHEVDRTDPRGWPAAMAERMGHAVVVLPAGDRLWVMGGWTQNGGPCGDIWSFDGRGWKPEPPGCDLCLFGAAATDGAVWRVGGFFVPGGSAQLTATRYDSDGTAHPLDVVIRPGRQYCASALFVAPGNRRPSGIGTLYAPSGYRHVLFSFVAERGDTVEVSDVESTSAVGVLMPRDYYHIQPAVFQGAAFFRTLVPDRDAPGSRLISYLVQVGSR